MSIASVVRRVESWSSGVTAGCKDPRDIRVRWINVTGYYSMPKYQCFLTDSERGRVRDTLHPLYEAQRRRCPKKGMPPTQPRIVS